MAIEVFNRHENKYLINEKIINQLQARIADQMELDAYNKKHETYTITNLYYDTDDSQLIRVSLQKPRYKEKLRLRGYGVPGLDDKVYVEIKKKVSGLVNKRRSAVRLADAYKFLESGILPEPQPFHNRQVLREVACILEHYDLKPSLYLAYDRRAYASTCCDLRISFDCNIRSRRVGLRLEAGDHGVQLLPDDSWLMEIKTANCMPIWLPRLLSEYKVYPVSFSKYGRVYQQQLASRAAAQIIFMPSVLTQMDTSEPMKRGYMNA